MKTKLDAVFGDLPIHLTQGDMKKVAEEVKELMEKACDSFHARCGPGLPTADYVAGYVSGCMEERKKIQ